MHRMGAIALLASATVIATNCGGSEFAGNFDGGTVGSGGSSTGGAGGTTGSGAGFSGSDATGGTIGTGSFTTSGGTGGAGGSAGSGGTGGSTGACTAGGVTFRLIPGGVPGSPGFCVGSCGASWVTIKSPDGRVLGNITHGCFASCTDCTPVACPAAPCIAPHRLASSGEETTWNGTLWVPNTCLASSGSNITCVNQLCVAPGSPLIATMCGYPNLNPDSGSYCYALGTAPTCVDVPFTYPTMTIVTGVLDPSK